MTRHEVIGWVLFTVSACCFLAASIRSGDMISIAGSLLFLIACFYFMVPLRDRLRKLRTLR